MNTNRIPAILRVLEKHGTCTPRQVAACLGIPYRCLYGAVNYLKHMNEEGLIHVFDWDRQEGKGGPPIPIYALGPGRNAYRPRPLSTLRKAPRRRPGPDATLFDTIGKKA